MFAYCNNIPVSMSDPGGNCSYFLGFKFDCKKATCPDSKNYNPNAGKAAVIYDGHTSGYFGGLFGGEGFARQGHDWATTLEERFVVEEYSFTNTSDFISEWNSLDGEYESIVILMHGYPGGLSCNGITISNSGRGDYRFSDLQSVSAKTVYLLCCDGATISKEGQSVALIMSDLTGGTVYAVANGSVKYALWGFEPYTEDGAWSTTRNGVTVFRN